MCVRIYIYIYIYTHTYTHPSLSICIYVYTCIFAYTHTHHIKGNILYYNIIYWGADEELCDRFGSRELTAEDFVQGSGNQFKSNSSQ